LQETKVVMHFRIDEMIEWMKNSPNTMAETTYGYTLCFAHLPEQSSELLKIEMA